MNEQTHCRLKKTNFAAFENFLAAKYERLIGAATTQSFPYIMTIDPCNICQLRCPNCYTGMINERHKNKKFTGEGRDLSRLSRGILESILDECGDVLFYCHFYNWGEPLLNEKLSDYIRSASERNIYTKLDTNLSLRCSDDKLKELLLSGLDELAASIDGFSQQTYEQYRIGGRFDLALENLKRLVEMRDHLKLNTKIIWNFLIFSFNEHEIDEVVAFCNEYNIEFMAKDAVILKSQSDWMPTYRREGRPNPYRAHRPRELQSSDWMTPSGVLPPYPGKPEGHRTCAWHYSYTTVNADGGVLPCCGLFSRKSDFGYVTAEAGSFGRLWNNENFEAARRNFPGGNDAKTTGPTAACMQCTRPETFRDHYALLDREIMRKYWSLSDESGTRWLDNFYTLLQNSPSEFAVAYAAYQADSAVGEFVY